MTPPNPPPPRPGYLWIQDLIHKFEVGEGVGRLRGVVSVLLILLLAVWYDFHMFQNFRAPEAMEAAQLARNLSRGEGFTTQCIRPLTLQLVLKQQGLEAHLSKQPHPDLTSPPVYPLLLAGLMKILPFNYEVATPFWVHQPEVLIAIFNQILFLLAVINTFRLARRLFDTWVAVTATTIMLGSDILWRFSVSGLSTCLLLLILSVLLNALVTYEEASRDPDRPTGWFVRQALLIGALLALGALTRYSFAWLILPTLISTSRWIPRRRWLTGLLISLVFLGALTPWLTRNYRASGTLFGVPGFALFQDTQRFPGTRLERSIDPDLAKVEARECVRKILGNAGELIRDELPRLGGTGWLAAFFLVSLFLRFRSEPLRRLRGFLLGSLIILLFVQAGTRTHLSKDAVLLNSENLLVVLLPGVVIFGTGLFFVLLEHLELAIIELRFAVTVLFILATSSQLIWSLLPPRGLPLSYPPYLPPWIQEVSGYLKTNELMMSDMPWAVAWYGDRACVWNTLDIGKNFFQINDEQKPIAGLYLTPITTDARIISEVFGNPDFVWSQFTLDILIHTNVPARFPLTHVRRKYMPDQIFMSDRPRWQEDQPAE